MIKPKLIKLGLKAIKRDKAIPPNVIKSTYKTFL